MGLFAASGVDRTKVTRRVDVICFETNRARVVAPPKVRVGRCPSKIPVTREGGARYGVGRVRMVAPAGTIRNSAEGQRSVFRYVAHSALKGSLPPNLACAKHSLNDRWFGRGSALIGDRADKQRCVATAETGRNEVGPSGSPSQIRHERPR